MTNKVTVFLRGGLGNQMFQYAFGLSWAKKSATHPVLDVVHVRDRFPRKNFTYRTFDLDVFTQPFELTALSKAQAAMPVPGLWLAIDLLAMQCADIFGIRTIVREGTPPFGPSVRDVRGNVLLYGRWQSEKYFKDIADEVRAAFTFRHAMEGEAKALAQQIGAVNAVSLHVRRGDYAAFKDVSTMMGDTNMQYYERAAAYIAERSKNPHFFIFSDDIGWCKKNVTLTFPATYVPAESGGPKESWHMELMSLCNHNIIANSTFSWWGAWLNAHAGKIVVAPKQWYADARGGDEDIVPATWTRI